MPTGLISKQSIVDEFTKNVTNKITYKYNNSNRPTMPSGYDQGTVPDIFSNDFPKMAVNNISGELISASTFVSDITAYIQKAYSNIRDVRVIARNRGDNTDINSDVKSKSVLNTNYKQVLNSVNLGTTYNTLITDPYWLNAYNAWLNASVNLAATITFTKHVRHSKHGSRIRR